MTEERRRRGYDDELLGTALHQVSDHLTALHAAARDVRDEVADARKERNELSEKMVRQGVILEQVKDDLNRRLGDLESNVKSLRDWQVATDLRLARQEGVFRFLMWAIPISIPPLCLVGNIAARLLWP